MRKDATPQENKLWYSFLRKHPVPFTRQKPVGNYIVDFLCPSRSLVIELDESQHFTDTGLIYDQVRTDFLSSLGLYVMRFTNTEINNSFDDVCTAIQDYLDTHDE